MMSFFGGSNDSTGSKKSDKRSQQTLHVEDRSKARKPKDLVVATLAVPTGSEPSSMHRKWRSMHLPKRRPETKSGEFIFFFHCSTDVETQFEIELT